jgi:predicted house-cleaning NTP pyrophosphatase (Maf/HAM1 superfamily)
VRAPLIFSIQGSENIRTTTSEPSYLLPRSQQTKKQSDARMTNRAGANFLLMNETTIVYEQEFLEKGYDMQRHLHCLATAIHKTRAI